jgi:hypothetical protein
VRIVFRALSFCHPESRGVTSAPQRRISWQLSNSIPLETA